MTLVADAVLAMAAVVLVGGTLATPRSALPLAVQLAQVLMLTLEFLLAAGLLRLSHATTFSLLGAVAVTVVLRRVIGTGLKLAVRRFGDEPG